MVRLANDMSSGRIILSLFSFSVYSCASLISSRNIDTLPCQEASNSNMLKHHFGLDSVCMFHKLSIFLFQAPFELSLSIPLLVYLIRPQRDKHDFFFFGDVITFRYNLNDFRKFTCDAWAAGLVCICVTFPVVGTWINTPVSPLE